MRYQYVAMASWCCPPQQHEELFQHDLLGRTGAVTVLCRALDGRCLDASVHVAEIRVCDPAKPL
jgi:hypothetical protein